MDGNKETELLIVLALAFLISLSSLSAAGFGRTVYKTFCASVCLSTSTNQRGLSGTLISINKKIKEGTHITTNMPRQGCANNSVVLFCDNDRIAALKVKASRMPNVIAS